MYNQTLAQKMQRSGNDSLESAQEEIVGYNKPKAVYEQTIAPTVAKQIPSIRTFQSDSAETIQTKQTSLAHMVIAEHSRNNEHGDSIITNTEPVGSSDIKKGIALVLSLILVASGVYGGLYLYRKSIANSNPITVIEEDEFLGNILEPRKQLVLPAGTNIKGNLNALLNDNAALNIGLGEIAEIIITKDQANPEEGKVSIPEFLASVGSKAPSTLIRALTPDYLIGVYKTADKVPFIILRNNNFQNSYAGLLLWEQDMYDDISWFMRTRTASSTELVSFTSTNPFSDDLVKNKDTRVLKDDSGIELISYAFADQNTIVITPNTDTLAQILTILEKQAFIRRR
ncbi:MAG: hypothetical protein V4526_02175 [Patescibacteria group bacterium]